MKGDYRMLSSKQKKCIELMARGELTHTHTQNSRTD